MRAVGLSKSERMRSSTDSPTPARVAAARASLRRVMTGCEGQPRACRQKGALKRHVCRLRSAMHRWCSFCARDSADAFKTLGAVVSDVAKPPQRHFRYGLTLTQASEGPSLTRQQSLLPSATTRGRRLTALASWWCVSARPHPATPQDQLRSGGIDIIGAVTQRALMARVSRDFHAAG